ncbi:hypothetical protein ACKGJO_09250 [Gracilimonas sp. Q87]|uniref:hypothetical protein n=1 Tax=Gracilimonas sp. Q87 TaxID=3384766 RepID=UPI003984040B
MPQKCQVCAHPKTHEIDKRLVQGESTHSIARDYKGLDYQNVWRHGQNHLPAKLVRHTTKQERAHAQDLFSNIQDALDEANEILKEARENKQNRLSLDAIKTILSANELFAKMIAKVKEFEHKDQQREDGLVSSHISGGLEHLTDNELKALTQLMSKVHSQSPDHELDPVTRMFVDSVSRSNDYDQQHRNKQMASGSDSPRNRPNQAKHTKRAGSTDLWDDGLDLELDDLDNLDLNEDPDWLKEYRKNNPSLPKRNGGR